MSRHQAATISTPAGSASPARRRAAHLAALLAVSAAALLWLAPAGAAQVSFSGPTNFAAGDGPTSVAVGHLNGDLHLDLAVANGSDTVSVLLGDGTGSFGAAANFAAGSVPLSVAVADLNGDVRLDLAVANFNSDTVSVLLGDGTGSFGLPTSFSFAAGDGPASVAVGDLNGDVRLDLAVANFNSDTVSVLLGGGLPGTFGLPTSFAAGDEPRSLAVADLNGDVRLDLAVANLSSGNVSVLLGDGLGSFGAATNFAAGDAPSSVAVGDLNGDRHLDLAVASAVPANISVLLGDGTGSFGAPTDFAAGSGPFSVAIGDLNGDRHPDLAVANEFSGVPGNVSVLLGDGTGSFGAATNFGAGTNPVSVAIADLNGDRRPDLAVANLSSDNVSVLLNTATPPANQPPSAVGDSYTADLDTTLTVAAPGVLANDSEPDGDALSAALVSGPSHGTLTLNSDGSFTYTPAEDHLGPDSFTYKASDGSLESNPATVSLTVRAACDGLSATQVGTGASERLSGTAGQDVIVGLGGDDTILGRRGNDRICGGSGDDALSGGAGDDVLSGGSGADILRGDRGDDALDGGPGSPDSCRGGAGTDTATPACEQISRVP